MRSSGSIDEYQLVSDKHLYLCCLALPSGPWYPRVLNKAFNWKPFLHGPNYMCVLLILSRKNHGSLDSHPGPHIRQTPVEGGLFNSYDSHELCNW